MTIIQELHAVEVISLRRVSNDSLHPHAATRFSGTDTTRIVLSALPDTRRSEEGLKRRVVGGNSCALRIVNSGCMFT